MTTPMRGLRLDLNKPGNIWPPPFLWAPALLQPQQQQVISYLMIGDLISPTRSILNSSEPQSEEFLELSIFGRKYLFIFYA
jgi:hypothetical protein